VSVSAEDIVKMCVLFMIGMHRILNPFHFVCILLLCLHYSACMPDQFFFLKHLWLVANRLRDTVIVYPNSEAPKCLNSEGPPKEVIIYKKKLFFFVLKNKLLQKKLQMGISSVCFLQLWCI
jgi:hypothetical protein